MISYLKKWKYLIFITLAIIIGASLLLLKINLNNHRLDNISSSSPIIEKKEEEKVKEETKEKFYVDIKGQVKNPNIYEVNSSMRINDVILLAGGLTKQADTSLINLSKKVTDEMTIIIYSKEEVKNSNLIETVVKEVEKECICPNIQNDSCINTEIDDSIPTTDNSEPKEDNHQFSLKTVTKEELLTIPGIGVTKAQAIITYREEKGFIKIEDLLNVPGIANSTYEKIKEYFIL